MKHCEYEDSTNCIWDAQVQGNGVGESFIDIEGETFYIGTPLEQKELPVLEEVPGIVVEVPVITDPVPEELAVTGTGDVVVGVLVGLALLAAGVVLFIRGRKNN